MLGDVANLGTIALLVALAAVNAPFSVALLRWHDDGDERADTRDGMMTPAVISRPRSPSAVCRPSN